MKETKTIHDRTFKASMKDVRVAREFFEMYLPERILSLVDLNTLKLSPNTYVDENLNSFGSDVLYEVKLKDNRLGFLYVLTEHQSTVDVLMAYRIWNYIIRIWADYIKQTGFQTKTLPLVFPLVFYNGKKLYDGCRSLRGLIDAPLDIIEDVLFKDFHLVDTHNIADEELRNQHWAGVLAFAFKHVYDREVWPHIDTLIGMMQKIQHEDGAVTYINNLLKYWLRAAETKKRPKEFIETVQQRLSVPIKGEIMTLAEQLIQQGVQQGVQQGIHHGIHQGESIMLIRQLERKFKIIPQLFKQKIEQADGNKLLMWGDRILDAVELEEIFAE